MAKNYFYESTSDADLAKEILAGCANVYIQKHEYSGKATYSDGGANDSFFLTGTDSASDDDYNSSEADNFYAIDDNSKLARGKVVDTISDTSDTEITVDTSSMVLVEDGSTSPTFTDGSSYTVLVLSGSDDNTYGDFFGYQNDSLELDTTIESEPLEICTPEGTMVEIAENATKQMAQITGATFNVPNKDVVSKVMNMTQYGDNTTSGRSEYHGGSAPDISNYYQITLLGEDFDGNNIGFTVFKGQLMTNGALGFSGTGWKTISWQYKGKRDTIRDSYSVDMYKYFRYS